MFGTREWVKLVWNTSDKWFIVILSNPHPFRLNGGGTWKTYTHCHFILIIFQINCNTGTNQNVNVLALEAKNIDIIRNIHHTERESASWFRVYERSIELEVEDEDAEREKIESQSNK